MTDKLYVIQLEDYDGELRNEFWNNDIGWGHLTTAFVLTEREKFINNLPIGGTYIELPTLDRSEERIF